MLKVRRDRQRFYLGIINLTGGSSQIAIARIESITWQVEVFKTERFNIWDGSGRNVERSDCNVQGKIK